MMGEIKKEVVESEDGLMVERDPFTNKLLFWSDYNKLEEDGKWKRLIPNKTQKARGLIRDGS